MASPVLIIRPAMCRRPARLHVLAVRSRAIEELIERQVPDLLAKGESASNSAGNGASWSAAEVAHPVLCVWLENTSQAACRRRVIAQQRCGYRIEPIEIRSSGTSVVKHPLELS